jgi:transposase InsO family protein
VRRFHEGGWEALRDRPPVARAHPRRLDLDAELQIVTLRRRTGWGPRRLAAVLGRPASTVWRVLVRHGVSRRARLPRPEVRRYEHAAAGDLLHVDIKKLGCFWQPGKRALGDDTSHNRTAGWEYVHVCVDDYTRLGHAVVLQSESPADCIRALRAHLAWLAERGIQPRRLLSDNGNAYRSHAYAAALRDHHLQHHRTRPRRPQTNGKAEAFIGILLREWAYGHVWHSSTARHRALAGYLRWYNTRRPHGSLGAPPLSRISQDHGSYT